jgi:hypothetical protein
MNETIWFARATEGSVILPDLEEIIAWFKTRIIPEDTSHGAGVSDWTITAEYVPNLVTNGERAYGAVCSPSDHESMLTADDVAAKRAHFLICTPENENDIREMYETFRHECEHILQSMYAVLGEDTRAAMENHAHSMGNFVAKLTPQEVLLFPRIKQNPMARAYRAKDKAMPDPTNEENKDKPDKAPAMAEGGPRDLSAIEKDLIAAVLAGQPTDELAKELVAAKALAGAGSAPASVPAPPVPPTMGMKPEDAYARKAAENTREAIEAIIEANPHLSKEQAAMARKQVTAKDARELVATYPRAANQNDQAKLGMQKNPKTDEHSNLLPLARAVARAEQNPMLRKVLGIGSLNDDGVHVEPSEGTAIYIDGTARLNHLRAKYRAKQEKRGAA